MPFDHTQIVDVEFAVAPSRGEQPCYQVPVTEAVVGVLREMLVATLNHLGDGEQWEDLEFGEKYGPTEKLRCPLDHECVARLRQMFEAENLPVAAEALNDPTKVSYYFARFRDANGHRCMGVKAAQEFKRAVGKKLMSYLHGQLTLVEGDVFRLDNDFDFLVFNDAVGIYRPFYFERIADIEGALITTAPQHVQYVAAAVATVDFSFAEGLVAKSSRARRVMSALKSRTDLDKVSKGQLQLACEKYGIGLIEREDGKLVPDPAHEMDFLEMLDRRCYIDPLVDQNADAYRALSRKKVTRA